jgi:hypothetical protein
MAWMKIDASMDLSSPICKSNNCSVHIKPVETAPEKPATASYPPTPVKCKQAFAFRVRPGNGQWIDMRGTLWFYKG